MFLALWWSGFSGTKIEKEYKDPDGWLQKIHNTLLEMLLLEKLYKWGWLSSAIGLMKILCPC